ncbi:cbb3-type cytochrome c oxidase N-terminal domain-containing protein [Larkinella sp. VNQ87]|uniref:cbb3-type cytochrome c oxidase N-terminal domain-containing protein n=1 Tax=Larkinella sp. VNQ87 TaxID=3400921 RepID=UPI003C07F9D8
MNFSTILLLAEPDTRWFRIDTGEDLFLAVILSILLMTGLLLLVLTVNLYLTVKQTLTPADTPEAISVKEKMSFWQRFTGLKPLHQEKDLMMEHQYDGIEELDNPTPPWFMYLFYGTIAIGVVYLVFYHVIGNGDVMVQEYTQEVAIAEKQREAYIAKVAGSINENTVTMVKDGPALEAGKTVFEQYCAACHGQNGEGKIGPNLTDEYWLHGGSIKAVYHTITEGVPDKGMVAWKNQLNPLQVQQVASYILSLQGSKPANAKEPQGDKVTPEAVAMNN